MRSAFLWVAPGLQDSLTLLLHVGHLHHRLHLGHVCHLHWHLLQGLALPHHRLSFPLHRLHDGVGKDTVGGTVDDWSSVMHNRVSQMVGSWMGHCMVCNGVGHGMGDRVSQEANTMVGR